MPRHLASTRRRNKQNPKILFIADGTTEINFMKSLIENKYPLLKTRFKVEYIHNLKNTSKVMTIIKSVHLQYYCIFALSDRDHKTNTTDTATNFICINKTYGNVVTGYSNPCFEIWMLLHNDYRDTSISAKQLVKKFSDKHGINYKTNSDIPLKYLPTTYNAIKNADRLHMHWEMDTCNKLHDQNPSTSVHNIIKKIEELIK